MVDLDRIVAGISCREVLAELSDVVDGTITADRAREVGAHVAGCTVCESFGGQFARAVRRVRELMGGEPGPVPDVTRARLRARLADAYVDVPE